MKSATLAAVVSACMVMVGCVLPTNWTDKLPVLITLKWEIEPGLFVVLQPADKGGYILDLEGEGEITDDLRVVEGGLEYTSPRTGLTYFVGLQPGQSKPTVQIIGAGGAPVEPRPVELKAADRQPPPVAIPIERGGGK